MARVDVVLVEPEAGSRAFVVQGEVHMFAKNKTKTGGAPFTHDFAINRDAKFLSCRNSTQIFGHGFEAFDDSRFSLDTYSIGETVGCKGIRILVFVGHIDCFIGGSSVGIIACGGSGVG